MIEALAPSNAANPTGEWQLLVFFDVQTPRQVRIRVRVRVRVRARLRVRVRDS